MLLAVILAATLQRDWAQSAVDDLHFIRATLRENHPGPVDSDNPEFQKWYRDGFRRSIARAERAKDFAGYFFAINFYMSGFNDGHLGALVERHLADHLAEDRLQRQWPKFTVRDADGAIVVDQIEGETRLHQGDRLVSCDGRPAATLAKEIVGDYVGLWLLPGERESMMPLLFIDEGNPFVKRPEVCKFGTRSIRLQWTPISGAELRKKFAAPPKPPPSLRQIGANGFWITLPSFSLGDKEMAAALGSLTSDIRARAESLRNARFIVFDVRGNRGGSSEAGDALLSAIWGETYINNIQPRALAIDWRVSPGNIRFLKDSTLAVVRRQFGPDSPQAKEHEQLIAGMQSALSRGDTFYRETIDKPENAAASTNVKAQAILLTDSVCASACLDFADVVLRLPGAEHFGKATSADALYIDNRAVNLPSSLGFFGFSMKVYRGRPRGNNQSYRPAHDAAALDKWISANQ